MYPVSERFLKAVRQSHRMVAYVDLFSGNRRVNRVPIAGGSVSLDRTAQVRAQVDLSIARRDIAGFLGDSTLTPYSTQVQVYRGILFADGKEETVPLAQAFLTEVTWDSKEMLSVRAFDRSLVIADAKFPTKRTIQGPSALDLIAMLAAEPWAATWNAGVINRPATLNVLPGVVDAAVPATEVDEDRWNAIQQLAYQLNAEVYASYNDSRLIVAPSPDMVAPAPVWTVDYGEAGSLADWEHTVTRENVYNAVSVQGKAASEVFADPYGYAEDTTPTSPTYVRTFGRRTLIQQVETLQTEAACLAAARQLLARSLGLSSSVDLSIAPNPALRPGDAVTVALPDGTTSTRVIDSLTIPLTPAGEFSLNTRTTNITLPA
ncbi:hypothetical protein GCM10029976_091010 [Kribbella albertanoniae]|uniref:DUF5047 domain-containing protein n=1 Tax=Kribbella albertanoniae TaxID=1266829 RepID=A0A4R4PK72_9ACTN|nr:DUF5047 domain-containing protein [Kribbella albertanoniae]TDC22457.1 DUF5047 domain-containing protein [Kribbella albertanoniae]